MTMFILFWVFAIVATYTSFVKNNKKIDVKTLLLGGVSVSITLYQIGYAIGKVIGIS